VEKIGKVLMRSKLTAALQRKVARQQFQPLATRPKELWTRWYQIENNY
jgi:hypothetical protein